ncbi:6-methylsalicylic acid decarboxylase atA [Fulvia fulva]|uniref:6-methylsalicylic acid decarboxylase atA n=1 Tax=Passalora fulva TaxID=5499 RepID=A0A9Q8L514_PASFU|nr:6-methylsalicylic acid decarboxylase atA [Fulvia fulva]KAK4634679.1 6-methylsalicylic acid decarboxylase atA [Fulvia fulva]KAK4636810.1 6-methylsalicylic acid decarboxylase atA [Fulvia fulva]UJO11000.1 6-methylsalicylic acid decarboxylase atA [Fulvia fulva]WPV08769.1 6-methylsalicylic acid decarboxylase atA [Fulvia fulva]WPV24105.1 6-methylsalicylic acid decarboxylase atA [Fulvia fulva]
MFFITVSGSAPDGWDSSVWKSEIDREHLERTFEGWDEKLKTGAIDAVMTSGPGVTFNQWESAPAPTYHRGRICMMGDAAHATSNWLGQGAAMAMEDCAVLVKLFELVEDREDVDAAFEVFDKVRRGGRADMVIAQSRLLGQILTGQKGLDRVAVKEHDIQAKREEIRLYDVTEQLHEAQDCFRKLKLEKV